MSKDQKSCFDCMGCCVGTACCKGSPPYGGRESADIPAIGLGGQLHVTVSGREASLVICHCICDNKDAIHVICHCGPICTCYPPEGGQRTGPMDPLADPFTTTNTETEIARGASSHGAAAGAYRDLTQASHNLTTSHAPGSTDSTSRHGTSSDIITSGDQQDESQHPSEAAAGSHRSKQGFLSRFWPGSGSHKKSKKSEGEHLSENRNNESLKVAPPSPHHGSHDSFITPATSDEDLTRKKGDQKSLSGSYGDGTTSGEAGVCPPAPVCPPGGGETSETPISSSPSPAPSSSSSCEEAAAPTFEDPVVQVMEECNIKVTRVTKTQLERAINNNSPTKECE